MKASAIEFRLRMWIQIVILFVGFWAPWIGTHDLSRRISTLAWLALEISRSGLASFSVATPVVIVGGAFVALIGAVLRVWGVAYLGYGVVHHGDMQGGAVVAAGPYRYMRNPLYLGGWFTFLAISLLMPPSGALFMLVLITIHFLRLILGEEAFLSARQGEPYREYLRAVPRLWPRLRSNLPRCHGKAALVHRSADRTESDRTLFHTGFLVVEIRQPADDQNGADHFRGLAHREGADAARGSRCDMIGPRACRCRRGAEICCAA